MAKQYRVVLTLQVPFHDPVEMPYGPAQPSRFEAVHSLMSALSIHADDDRWTALQSIRIDVTDEEN